MTSKTSLYLKISLITMLLIDIARSIFFILDYNALNVFNYAIFSSIIYLIMFSINREPTDKDIKFYILISILSVFLFTIISFSFNDRALLSSLIFMPLSYVYYTLRTKYKVMLQVVLINLSYMFIRFGCIFLMIYILGLMSLGI